MNLENMSLESSEKMASEIGVAGCKLYWEFDALSPGSYTPILEAWILLGLVQWID